MTRAIIIAICVLLAACAVQQRSATAVAYAEAPPPPPPPPPPPELPPPPEPPPPPPPPSVEAAIAGGAAGPAAERPRARSVSSAPFSPRAALPFTGPQAESDAPAEGPEASLAEEGVAAFVKPPPMEVDRWAVIEFVAGPSENRIRAETEGRTLTAPTAIYVAKTMRVTLLNDPAFDIKAKSEAVQNTGVDRTATWLWDVRPKRAAAHPLIARVEVLRALPGGGYETIEQYTRQVEVRVKAGALRNTLGAIDQAATLGDRLTLLFNSWQKAVAALAALVVAVGVLMWRLGVRKRRPEA